MNCPLPNKIIKKALNISDFNITEIRGGISKKVYKINTNADNFILYIWLRPYEGSLIENQTVGSDYLFADGFKYFLHNTKLLTDIGIRVPQIITKNRYNDGDFDYAIVECFNGISLDDYMQGGGDVAKLADKITELMNKMSVKKRDYYGSPLELNPNNISSAQLVLNFYAEELNIASKIDSEINILKPKIIKLMQDKLNEIVEIKDQEYSLIHGELTPSHIFLLNDGSIGIIDIEGVKYFDIEYDWAVIDFMYGDKIELPKNINKKKLEFYKLCLKVGYMSGSTDYLINVDNKNETFRNIRDCNMSDLKIMIS